MYQQRWAKGKRIFIKKCNECGKEFVPAGHKKDIRFCSYVCASKANWIKRERKIKKLDTKKCIQCGNEFKQHIKYSTYQWAKTKFCSRKCCGQYQKATDGMTKHERARRKRGQLKQGSPEWLEAIKAKTRESMYRPDVQEKIRKPKGPMSHDRKMIISNALVGKMPLNIAFGSNGSYPNVQRGDYECSKGTQYFRSKWEANYALFLDFLIKNGEIVNWEYEPETFFFEKIKLGTRSYRPDFKVFNNNGSTEIHEVKGYMDAKSKTKLKRMAKYFPDVKLILIDVVFYKDMMKKMKGVIKFY